MILPQLLRALWPIIICGIVLLFICALLLTICIPWFGLFKGHPQLRLMTWLAPFAYPLACWALFSWAASHDRRVGEDLLKNGVAASATVTEVRDLGIDVNINPLLTLRLRVAPPEGVPFDTELSVNPSRLEMHNFQPGIAVRVRYDARDRSRITLDE